MKIHPVTEACLPSETIEVDISKPAVPSVFVGDTVMLDNGSAWVVDTVADTRNGVCLKNEKGQARCIRSTPNGKYQGGNQLRIQRIIRPSLSAPLAPPNGMTEQGAAAVQQETCSDCFPLAEATELLSANNNEQLARKDSEYLANIVAAGLTTLAALRPYVDELWRRFDSLNPGEMIRGCTTKKQFCLSVLKRDPRTVRYMLNGGNPVSKRKPPKTAETVSAPEANAQHLAITSYAANWLKNLIVAVRSLKKQQRIDLYKAMRDLLDRKIAEAEVVEDTPLADTAALAEADRQIEF